MFYKELDMKTTLKNLDWTTIKNILLLIFILIITMGCTSKPTTGKVKFRVTSDIAHIDLGIDKVKVNDKVYLYQNHCDSSDSKVCKLDFVGAGKVTKLFNKSYSEIRTDGSFVLFKDFVVATTPVLPK
jgi:hypothetical protein